MVRGSISAVDGSVSKGVNDFLKELLVKKVVEEMMVPQNTSSGLVFPTLISDPDALDSDVFAPVLPTSSAKALSHLTRTQGFEHPVGVVLRSCQLRAAIELAKLKQVDMKNLLLIGVECPGTVPINTFDSLKGDKTKEVLAGTIDGMLRQSCKVCKDPVPVACDIRIGIFGMDTKSSVIVESCSEHGESVLKEFSFGEAPDEKTRDTAIEKIRKERADAREAFVNRVSGVGLDGLMEFYASCVNCHNCKAVCPICYCRECLFESEVFESEAYKYVRRAHRKGGLRMPDNTLLFQIGRMNHMILSCVECGLCEQACPVGIPLMEVFLSGAEKAQKEFGYHPGVDPEEKIPMIVYREDEYEKIGE